MSVETKQCSICVDAPPYRQCLAVGTDECAYVVSLQAALREALEAWEWWIGARQGATPKPDFAIKRIAELRKFLDDK